jgi:hypothetical protein
VLKTRPVRASHVARSASCALKGACVALICWRAVATSVQQALSSRVTVAPRSSIRQSGMQRPEFDS